MVILSKLRTLKVDITSSPDYGSEATRRAKALVDEIMSTISKQQSKIMQRGNQDGCSRNRQQERA